MHLCMDVHVAILNVYVCDIYNKYALHIFYMCKEIDDLRRQHLVVVQKKGGSEIFLIWMQ